MTTSTQASGEVSDIFSKFDKDFLEFIAEYELLFGKISLGLEDKDVIEEYIRNVKQILLGFE